MGKIIGTIEIKMNEMSFIVSTFNQSTNQQIVIFKEKKYAKINYLKNNNTINESSKVEKDLSEIYEKYTSSSKNKLTSINYIFPSTSTQNIEDTQLVKISEKILTNSAYVLQSDPKLKRRIEATFRNANDTDGYKTKSYKPTKFVYNDITYRTGTLSLEAGDFIEVTATLNRVDEQVEKSFEKLFKDVFNDSIVIKQYQKSKILINEIKRNNLGKIKSGILIDWQENHIEVIHFAGDIIKSYYLEKGMEDIAIQLSNKIGIKPSSAKNYIYNNLNYATQLFDDVNVLKARSSKGNKFFTMTKRDIGKILKSIITNYIDEIESIIKNSYIEKITLKGLPKFNSGLITSVIGFEKLNANLGSLDVFKILKIKSINSFGVEPILIAANQFIYDRNLQQNHIHKEEVVNANELVNNLPSLQKGKPFLQPAFLESKGTFIASKVIRKNREKN
ncbi:hypothetical protein [Mesoplasma photuris]|uniref:hypothetical protein n=1 Tax=Mesoplasma photuris TaxID=217731 RepID=UPI0004E1C9D2|nr:hypothetical protein [Mesoplasma photuris]